MVVNFRARGISRGARKLTRISTLIKKKIYNFEKTFFFISNYRLMIVILFFNKFSSYFFFVSDRKG